MNPTLLTDPQRDVSDVIRRYLFGGLALVCGIASLLLLGDATPSGPAQAALVALGGATSVYAAIAWRRTALRSDSGVMLVSGAGMALIGGMALVHGWGLNGPTIGFLAILVFLVAATVGAGPGIAAAVASTALLVTLAWAEQRGLLPGAAVLANIPLGRRLLSLLLLLAVGLACGGLARKVFNHYLGASAEREQRFRALLGIATEAYWEMDEHYELTSIWRRGAGDRFVGVPYRAKRPWDAEAMVIDPNRLAAHRADLDARRSFRNLHVRWRRPDGSIVHHLVSGEPRFDRAGRFLGYWGVSRDVTDRVSGADALRRSETMLAHLVDNSPDLITLTDQATGRYVMVNEAFTRYTGYSAHEAIGRTSVELGVWSEPSVREDFLQRLRESGAVKDLPTGFVSRTGVPFSLLISAASFELEGARYLVINGRDVTQSERTRLAHEAVLANASLGIAFTRDRVFVQANPALERMLGWAPGMLNGQPGRVVWSSDAEYEAIGTLVGPPLSRGEPVELVRELTCHDGTRLWCRILAKAVDTSHPMAGGTIWIMEDITERRRTDQALAKARDDAEAANRAKSAFLANTSHEIRTPLNGLLGLVRLAQRPDLDEKRRLQYLEQIDASAQTLATLISDVLDLSKIEAGKLDVEAIAFDLRALLESLRQAYGLLAEARGLHLSVEVAPDVPQWTWGDPMRLRQVLGNFLSNALKFTAQGSVALRAHALGGDRLRFEVFDSGPGIAADVRERLFTPFTQGDESTTRRFGGSGLGLSICRELATLMGGSVGVDSEPGKGSCFWAELPLATTEAPASHGDHGALGPAPLVGRRVLIVEDNAVNMTVAVALLEHWGVEVIQATDGLQAVAEVERCAREGRLPDAVLMDVQMPVMSGYEATRRLREMPAGRALTIIALTAAALTSERDQALDSGMDGFLTKPIDARKLYAALSDVRVRNVT